MVLGILILSSIACSVSVGGYDIFESNIEGSGNVISEEFNINNFSGLDFSGVGRVIVELGDSESLRVEAEDNLLEYIEIEVRDDFLQIGIEKGVSFQPTKEIIFYITVVELNNVTVSGLGDIEFPEMNLKSFDVQISGAGNVNVQKLFADDLLVQISGLGSLGINGGRIYNQIIEISGSGNYEGANLESDVALVDLSGLGSSKLWVNESLDVTISGAGSVHYAGEPEVSSDISGVGRLEIIER
jgi:hypothetical protein